MEKNYIWVNQKHTSLVPWTTLGPAYNEFGYNEQNSASKSLIATLKCSITTDIVLL